MSSRTGARIRRLIVSGSAVFLVVLLRSRELSAYSVLTHMQIVDLVWADTIVPLLLRHYPGLSEEQITEAHAYAYGGSVIQDLGYYPFGSKEFSDLVHYARSGDFVTELIAASQDVNEYAFALGALSHYTSDVAGHPAVNQAVAIEYPKLQAKYGKSVTFAQDKGAHLKTEFGFDMAQVAKNRYASEQYHDYIGFKVSKPLIERVFPIVYGVELKDVLPRVDLTIGSYRFAVATLIPEMTQIALQIHKKELIREIPSFAKEKFLYRLSRSAYEKQWGKDYQKPGFFSRVLSVVMRIVPRKGPFKALAFNNPTPATEELYFKSINTTVDDYRGFLAGVRANALVLPNRDLDDGKASKAGEYSLADKAYAKLLVRQSEGKFVRMPPSLRANILSFYAGIQPHVTNKKDREQWQSVTTALEQLKLVPPVRAP